MICCKYCYAVRQELEDGYQRNPVWSVNQYLQQLNQLFDEFFNHGNAGGIIG